MRYYVAHIVHFNDKKKHNKKRGVYINITKFVTLKQ